MYTDRRQFIKTAGTSVACLSLSPVLQRISPFWMGNDPFSFPRATPESQGVASSSIRAFLSAANASDITWHSFMLVRHGKVIAEGWWHPFASTYVHSLYSLSKSFTSTAIGLLVKEGQLDIHSPLLSFFPNDAPDQASENLRQMTVRHLLMMNTGHDADTMPKMKAASETWTRTYLAQPVPLAPGSHFLYNTGNTYMLGAILHQVTGKTLQEYLGPRFFQPLGITGYDWETSPQGLNTGGYGLRVKTEDIAKLGQLYLQKGNWNGKVILPENWVQEATSFQTTSQTGNADWSQGYGYQFWRCTHGAFRGDGAYGQYCIVMPELDAVLAVTSQSHDMQKSLNIIWDHLPSAMQSGSLPENQQEQTGLQSDLNALTLPVVKGSTTSPLSVRYDQKTWAVAANDFDVQTVQLSFSDKNCQMSVVTGTKRSVFTFGWENWLTSDTRDLYVFKSGDLFPMPSRVAGTATWSDDHSLLLNVRFVEAIFGDALTCVFNEDQLTVSFLNSLTAMDKTKTDPRKILTGKKMVG
jgi:CubicO group peptidase (beta-lactamase class C family)